MSEAAISTEDRDEAAAMLRDGHEPAEIAEWLGCRIIDLPVPEPRPVPGAPGGGYRSASRDELVSAALEAGFTRREVRERFGLTKGQVAGLLHRQRKANA